MLGQKRSCYNIYSTLKTKKKATTPFSVNKNHHLHALRKEYPKLAFKIKFLPPF